MANATPNAPGQQNGSGSLTTLFLKVFGGEVFAAFKNQIVALERHTVRSITSGKSATFPFYGTVTASYHTPGTEITGQSQNYSEQVITLDSLLISPLFIASIDEYMNEYDLRGPAATEVAYALANGADQRVLQVAGLAARGSAPVTGGDGGTAITSSTAKTSSTAIISAMFSAAQNLDTKKVPSTDRNCFMLPAQYYLLVQDNSVISWDYTRQMSADRQTGDLGFGVAGIKVIKTNNVPTTNVTTGPAAYQGDFSTTAFLITHPSAVGTLKMLDLQTEAQYDVRRQGTLVLAKYLMGHGVLRPEAAVEVKTA